MNNMQKYYFDINSVILQKLEKNNNSSHIK